MLFRSVRPQAEDTGLPRCGEGVDDPQHAIDPDIEHGVLTEVNGDNLVLINESKYILNWEPDAIVNINLGLKNPRHCVSLEQIKQQIK